MMDHLLSMLLRGSIVGLITACVVASAGFLYSAVLEVIAGRLQPAATALILSAGCAIAVAMLCRYRNDLIYY